MIAHDIVQDGVRRGFATRVERLAYARRHALNCFPCSLSPFVGFSRFSVATGGTGPDAPLLQTVQKVGLLEGDEVWLCGVAEIDDAVLMLAEPLAEGARIDDAAKPPTTSKASRSEGWT